MQSSFLSRHPVLWTLIKIAGGFALFGVVLVAALALLFLANTSLGQAGRTFAAWLLAGDPPNATWYITRAAGLVAYLLLWLSTVWGLILPTRLLEGKLHGIFSMDFHEFVSLLALGFTGLHVLILLVDSYEPFSVAQVLVPFISHYRPGWVGLGILSLYAMVLVTVTFYLRNRIGAKTFRSIHTFSLLGFVGAAVHGLFSGTDSSLVTVQGMYGLTFLSVLFLTTYWLAGLAIRKAAGPRTA